MPAILFLVTIDWLDSVAVTGRHFRRQESCCHDCRRICDFETLETLSSGSSCCQHGVALKRGLYGGTLINPVDHFISRILPLKKAYHLQSSQSLS